MSEVSKEKIGAFIDQGAWRKRFDTGAVLRGDKLVAGKLVSRVLANPLDGGDVEITATVTEKDGQHRHPTLVFWLDNGTLALDSDCSCGLGSQCDHVAAVLAYLTKGKGARLATAFGEHPQVAKVTGGKHLDPGKIPSQTPKQQATPRFLLRVERRPDGERLAWLPEIYAQAFALYDSERMPLEPSGNLPSTTLLQRDRVAEMEAVRTLYALDLLPGAETPPQSLRKRERPPGEGTLWAADRQQWPHADYYWQRFQHEGTPALEKRGWEVQFSAHVGLKPLIFRTETWKAEIVDEGKGWFTLSAGFEIDGERFALQPILAALVENRFLNATKNLPAGQEFLIFLPDGRGLALPVGRFRKILITLGELMRFKFGKGPIKLGKLDAALLVADEVLEVEGTEEIEELAQRVAGFHRIDRAPLPAGLRADLRSYQLDGYYWMQFLCRYALNGILADDMGLGKTLQTLTHLLAEKESGRTANLPSLVIAPTSVVENWQRESAKFTPGLRVLLLQGADRRDRFNMMPTADLVLTSYALLTRDLEQYLEQPFHLVVLDEAQHVKNPAANVSQAACQLNAKHRLCLSGTPVENNLGELWSLMHFLMPGLLGTQSAFQETFRTPIEKNADREKAASLAARVGPLILRRTKNEVAKELPPKTEIMHTIELNEAQKDLYETVRSTMDKQVRQALELQGTQSQIAFLDALLKLRQICCHPQLLENQEHYPDSSKFDYLIGLLETLREEKHRVLIFSQFTSMLRFIEEYLQAVQCSYLKLTGETQKRQELVERFQGGEGEVFLISLKAGGTGLTLTGADTVIHYDPWWNPAAENQATDRAYRIGQDKPVMVHKLLCKGTVEERIQQMQTRKGSLASDLLSGATRQLSLTPETLETLLAPI